MLENKSIEDCAKEIKTKEDFDSFLERLLDDLKKGSWENGDLESYLTGIAGFAKDMAGYYSRTQTGIDSTRPSWRVFADILIAGRVYE